MSRSLTTICVLVFIVAGATTASSADPPASSRGVFIEEVRNDEPAFLVRVDVDRPSRTYYAGDELQARVKSAHDGYLYLLYCDASNQVSCLFPNAFEADNRITADREIIIPRPAEPGVKTFRIKISAPFGEELLKAIVSTEPLPAESLAHLMKTTGDAVARRAARGAIVEQVKSTGWAEHHVGIVTKAAPAEGTATSARRIALCIGISDFADPQIHDLTVAHTDARAMADVLQNRCAFEQPIVLLNQQATRQNIEHVLRRQLPTLTRPGDTVVIYWSGHGGRCADIDGDEKDGFDEYLVPHDGQLTSSEAIRNSMILDDTFGRWLQELDGRRILVILDTCHSGGQAQEKSLLAGNANLPPTASFDFLDGELKRIKDIGQRETALLASSTARQVSFERREGDLSTMTFFLIEQLSSGSEPLELRTAFQRLEASVAQYVEKTFPGTTQTPILIENLTAPIVLRPESN